MAMNPQLPTAMHKFPLSCMSAKFSPFQPDLIACATSENFGIAGNSLTYFIKFDLTTHQMQIINQIPSPNAIFDISWSEQNPDLLVGACGDGNIRLFKMGQNQAIGQ